MNERAFGSRVRRFCAILAILCIPYQDISRFQSFSCPSSRTRLTTYGALASRSIESLSTSQKRYSENECMNSLSLIDTKIVTFSDTRLKLVFEIAECIRIVRESKITFHVDVPQSALEWGLAWKVRRKVCTFHAYMPCRPFQQGSAWKVILIKARRQALCCVRICTSSYAYLPRHYGLSSADA